MMSEIHTIGYITDIEGNTGYLNKSIANSEVLSWDNAARTRLKVCSLQLLATPYNH